MRLTMPEPSYGVFLNQLHCPTCGCQFHDFRLHSEEEEFTVEQIRSPIRRVGVGRKYLLCPSGHRWSVKMIWRRNGYPDQVQLDQYLGANDA
jgi:hypothetical protein